MEMYKSSKGRKREKGEGGRGKGGICTFIVRFWIFLWILLQNFDNFSPTAQSQN